MYIVFLQYFYPKFKQHTSNNTPTKKHDPSYNIICSRHHTTTKKDNPIFKQRQKRILL